MTYTNQKPAYYLNRQFKITCSEMSKRFVSNEYTQTLTVVHPDEQPDQNDQGKQGQYVNPKMALRVLDEQSIEEVGFKDVSFSQQGHGDSKNFIMFSIFLHTFISYFFRYNDCHLIHLLHWIADDLGCFGRH